MWHIGQKNQMLMSWLYRLLRIHDFQSGWPTPIELWSMCKQALQYRASVVTGTENPFDVDRSVFFERVCKSPKHLSRNTLCFGCCLSLTFLRIKPLYFDRTFGMLDTYNLNLPAIPIIYIVKQRIFG